MHCILTSLQPVFLVWKYLQLQAELLFASTSLFWSIGHILPCWTCFKSYYLCLATYVYATFLLVLATNLVVCEDSKKHLSGPWLILSLSRSPILVPYLWFWPMLRVLFLAEYPICGWVEGYLPLAVLEQYSWFLSFFTLLHFSHLSLKILQYLFPKSFSIDKWAVGEEERGWELCQLQPSPSHYIAGKSMEIQIKYSPFCLVWSVYINSTLQFSLS